MTDYLVPAAVLGLLGLALQSTVGAIKLARTMLAERYGTGSKASPDLAAAVIADVAVLSEKLSAIDRHLTGVHKSVHDLRDEMQPIVARVAVHEKQLAMLEARQ